MFPTDQVAMCGGPLAPVGESSVTVPWQSVESVIGLKTFIPEPAWFHSSS
jgi:hypothetical protein